MAEHNRLGTEGERAAMQYLVKAGYNLHEHSWRSGHLEIDIVAEWWGEWVFVEVKTRSDEHYAPAASAVTLSKKRNIIAAARAYMASHGLQGWPYRFDIITVVGAKPPFRIEHLTDAYTEEGVHRESHPSRHEQP